MFSSGDKPIGKKVALQTGKVPPMIYAIWRRESKSTMMNVIGCNRIVDPGPTSLTTSLITIGRYSTQSLNLFNYFNRLESALSYEASALPHLYANPASNAQK